MSEPWLILDCDYLCHRAKHVFGDLSYADSATGVIYGFLKDVLALRERFHTERFVFCWDSSESKRKSLWPHYKEHRQKPKELSKEEEDFEWAFRTQMAKLRNEYLHTIGYRNIFQQSGYESDDIMAAVGQRMRFDSAIMITADQDLFQCIRRNIQWFNPRTKELITLGRFRQKFGIEPRQWVKVKAIAGCSSDNIPGIPGVGEKKALQYIKREMKTTHKAYQSIKTNWTKIVLRNRPLVELPFPGLIPLHLEDDDLTQTGFNAVCKVLGMKSIRYRRII